MAKRKLPSNYHLKLAQIVNHERKTLTSLGKINAVQATDLFKAEKIFRWIGLKARLENAQLKFEEMENPQP
jgi:hypothetical protein